MINSQLHNFEYWIFEYCLISVQHNYVHTHTYMHVHTHVYTLHTCTDALKQAHTHLAVWPPDTAVHKRLLWGAATPCCLTATVRPSANKNTKYCLRKSLLPSSHATLSMFDYTACLYMLLYTLVLEHAEANLWIHNTIQLLMGRGVILEFFSLQNGASICSVLMGDTITIGKVNKLPQGSLTRLNSALHKRLISMANSQACEDVQNAILKTLSIWMNYSQRNP